MDKNLLRQQYIDACNAYLEAFCEKHGFDYDNAANSWVAGNVGDCCILGDYCISFDDIKTDIDMDAQECQYFAYYGYALEAQDLGFICPNYENWIRGCPTLSGEQIKSLRETKNRVYETKKDFERILEEENDKATRLFWYGHK